MNIWVRGGLISRKYLRTGNSHYDYDQRYGGVIFLACMRNKHDIACLFVQIWLILKIKSKSGVHYTEGGFALFND